MLVLLDLLKQETNYAYTENGALAHKTTTSSLLDFFATAGSMRNRSDEDVINSFTKAFSEDKLLAIKALFYFRDIRGGSGERRLFRVVAKYLANHHTEYIKKNLHLIPELGRWDDLYVFFDTPLENNVINLFAVQLMEDQVEERPSLLAKWLKSENASSEETKRLARKTCKGLGFNSEQYRKLLSKLRKKIDIVESKMSANEWSQIDYEKVSSQASLKYRKAFQRNDDFRYELFLENLEKGEAKINTGTLYPYQLVEKVIGSGWIGNPSISQSEYKLYNEMWNNLPNYIGNKKENAIAVVDVSGSMNGTPMHVAISLGLYMAEKNKGAYHNHFITFSENPSLEEIIGDNFVEKARNIKKADWGYSTNIEAVFDLILNTAIKNKVPKSEMVDKLYIVSDMEFNYATSGGDNKTLMQSIRDKYEEYGYNLPKLTFWNVDARNDQFPVTASDAGVQLVSGFSPSLFEQTMSGKEAYDLMIDTLNQPRYESITI
jgi:hypothetical protein